MNSETYKVLANNVQVVVRDVIRLVRAGNGGNPWYGGAFAIADEHGLPMFILRCGDIGCPEDLSVCNDMVTAMRKLAWLRDNPHAASTAQSAGGSVKPGGVRFRNMTVALAGLGDQFPDGDGLLDELAALLLLRWHFKKDASAETELARIAQFSQNLFYAEFKKKIP